MGAARAALSRWRDCLPGAPEPGGGPYDFRAVWCDDARASLTAALDALAAGGSVALLDPALPPPPRARAEATVVHAAAREPGVCSIATGGSSGEWRLARHNVETLWAAAEGFTTCFPHLREHWSPLPVYHVSGWMPVWRALTSEGECIPADYRDWLAGRFPRQPGEGAVLSLVPTQLHRLMESPAAVAFLRRFACILVGGAATGESLRVRARSLEIPLAPSYGMTETAAAVAILPAFDFLEGAGGCGLPLPHVSLTLVEDTGRLLLDGPSLFDGYLTPEGFVPRPQRPWQTSDGGALDAQGRLHVHRRFDRLIATGGEKVAPDRIESLLRAIPGVREAVVFGIPDAAWGEVVAVALETSDPQTLRQAWPELRENQLRPAERPRRWWITDQLPRNVLGKITLASLRAQTTAFTPEP